MTVKCYPFIKFDVCHPTFLVAVFDIHHFVINDNTERFYNYFFFLLIIYTKIDWLQVFRCLDVDCATRIFYILFLAIEMFVTVAFCINLSVALRIQNGLRKDY